MTVRNETILIIEEDDDLRRLLSLALRLAGFPTREASHGLEAMAILEQLFPIAAVVLDIVLPDIDGLSIRQEIAAHAGGIPVIVISESQEPLPHLHPSCVLRKPVEPDDIVTAVVKCLPEAVSHPAVTSLPDPSPAFPQSPRRRRPVRPSR